MTTQMYVRMYVFSYICMYIHTGKRHTFEIPKGMALQRGGEGRRNREAKPAAAKNEGNL